MEDRRLIISIIQVFCRETTAGLWRLLKHTLCYMTICHLHRGCHAKNILKHMGHCYTWIWNWTKDCTCGWWMAIKMQRCTVYCSLFSIYNGHINLLEWCFVGCYIALFGVATLVMSIACLLPKCRLQTDRIFTSGCLMNCKIDFRLQQSGRCPPFWHQNPSPGMTNKLFISNGMLSIRLQLPYMVTTMQSGDSNASGDSMVRAVRGDQDSLWNVNGTLCDICH